MSAMTNSRLALSDSSAKAIAKAVNHGVSFSPVKTQERKFSSFTFHFMVAATNSPWPFAPANTPAPGCAPAAPAARSERSLWDTTPRHKKPEVPTHGLRPSEAQNTTMVTLPALGSAGVVGIGSPRNTSRGIRGVASPRGSGTDASPGQPQQQQDKRSPLPQPACGSPRHMARASTPPLPPPRQTQRTFADVTQLLRNVVEGSVSAADFGSRVRERGRRIRRARAPEHGTG